MIYTNYYRITDPAAGHNYVHAEAYERRQDAIQNIIDTDSSFCGQSVMGRNIKYIGSHVSDFGLGNPKATSFMALAERAAYIGDEAEARREWLLSA